MPSILRGISRRSDCIFHSFLSSRAVINFCHSNFWASSARTGVHPGIFITSRWQLARGTPCSPSHCQYAPFTGLLSGPCCCCCLALSLLLMIYKFPRHFISFEVDTQNAWQREQKRTGIERERGTGGLQWCVLNWNRMLKLSKHCSAGDLFSALPRGPLLYTRMYRQTEGCSVAIGKWFWVIYFIVALKYLLFWKAPNNAMINLKGLPCPPLATPPPPSFHSWLRVEQVWRTNPLKIPCGHVPKPNQFFSLF